MLNEVMETKFQGLWPALLTPTNVDGTPNIHALEKLIDALIAEHVDGLYLLGSTGQGLLFTEAQRCAVAEAAVNAVSRRVPLIVQVGANTTAESVRLAKHAGKAGVDAISAIAPSQYPYGLYGVFEHYRKVAGATQMPFFPYHLATTANFDLDPDEFANRVLALPNISGIKFTSIDLVAMGRIHDICGEKVRIFSGADHLLCHAVLSGAVGAIGSYYNLWPSSCKAAREAVVHGNVSGARTFMLTFQRAIAMTVMDIWSFLHAGMRLKYGINTGATIPPLGNTNKKWDNAEVERIIKMVDDAAPELESTRQAHN